MYDLSIELIGKNSQNEVSVLKSYGLAKKAYVLATIHRQENTDTEKNLRSICKALIRLAASGITVFFPGHPRTRKFLEQYRLLGSSIPESLVLSEPVSYGDMMVLESNTRVIVTDSGGVQKEAFFYRVPLVISRSETEWVEIVQAGKAVLTGPDENRIVASFERVWNGTGGSYTHGDRVGLNVQDGEERFLSEEWPEFYGDGTASGRMCEIIKSFFAVQSKEHRR
jgi:UDP-GlcNAc3NAcA epimerase